MPFKDTNTVFKVPEDSDFQVGRSNVDPGVVVEKGVGIPWASDPQASWIYYDCAVGTMLDSGIVVHNRLPQVDREHDTLSVTNLDDPEYDRLTGFGVNLRCRDQYRDCVQRMGHARYWFRIWGQAIRVGYQVPIPSIKRIGGRDTIPYDKNPQWAYNTIVPGGNYSGVIMWHAQWSLWYTTDGPPYIAPGGIGIPAFNPTAHINGNAPLPDKQQAPYTQPDDNAQRQGPPQADPIRIPVGTI